MKESLLTVKELSSFLHVHPKTVYRWAKNGQIRHIKKDGLGIRFKEREIDDWIESGQIKAIPIFQSLQKLDLSLENYDKMLLKGRSALSKSSKRWCYGFGTVYIRKTKEGKTRYCIDYRGGDGRRKREVIKTAQSRAEALLALQRKISDIFDSQYSPAQTKQVAFEEFANLYLENFSKLNKKSWKCDSYALGAHLIPYFGEFKLSEFTPLLIEKYRAERLKAGVRKSSTNREMALLKKMFNLAIDWQYAKENPVRKVKLFSEKDNLKERVLSEEEETRLLAECADHLRPIIVVALNTGMRKSEILTLSWDRVDMNLRLIHVSKTKSGKDRMVPINDALLGVFEELRRSGIGKYVFTNPETGLPFKSVRHSFENACRRANIHGLRFHDTRHTFSCRMIQRGCDIETLRDLLGHHSVTVTQRYIHTNLEQKRQAVELLSAKKAAGLSPICHADGEEKAESAVTPLFSVN